MGAVITSRKFYNLFTGLTGGGTTYMGNGVASYVRCVMETYFAWNLEEVRLQFTTGDGTIAMLNDSDGRDFITQEFKVDDTITIVGTTSNNGDFTITAISEDGRTITVAEALVTEKAESASVHGVTPITCVDLYYNLIENDETETFYSKVDIETQQRYTAFDVDATETIHETTFRALTKSRAWVTNLQVDADTGECPGVTIIGDGVTDYKQKFIIDHVFRVTPMYTPDQLDNFENDVAPDYYLNGASLKCIHKIEGRFDSNNPEADHSVLKSNDKGSGGWFDRGKMGRKPEYYVSDIAYSIGGSAADELDVNQSTIVTITFKSVSGTFVNGASRILLNFHACPSEETDYQNTGTTLPENFFFDTYQALVGAVAGDGTLKGTGYGCINDCTYTIVDANTVTVAFTFAAEANLQTYWQGKEDNDRYYAISLVCADSTITETKSSDDNTALADFRSAAYDKTDSTLFEFTGSGLYCYPYPDNGTYGVGNIAGFEGDQWIVKVPFRVYNDPVDGLTPTVKTIKVQVLAAKTGNDDFILEEKQIDCSNFRKLDNVQQLAVSEERGFISYDDDPRNAVTIERDAANDTATMAAYELSYGLILRYEDWIDAFDSQRMNSDGVNTVPDVAKEIEDVTMRWANYSGVNGWALKFRFTIVITGTDDYDNEYYSDINMSVLTMDQIEWTGIGGGATQSLQYFLEDESEELFALNQDALTLVRCTWTGDFPEPVDANGYFGQMFAVVNNVGSIFSQRFASSEIPSEADSPWSATDADPTAATSYANGNLRINIYETAGTVTSIRVEGYFDSTYLLEETNNIIIYPRLGVKYIAT